MAGESKYVVTDMVTSRRSTRTALHTRVKRVRASLADDARMDFTAKTWFFF